jgi:hypothetical protein
MGVSATMKAISPRCSRRSEALQLRVIADHLGLEPVDTDLEGPRERGEIGDERGALGTEAGSDQRGQQHHGQAETGEQRGHGCRPPEAKSLDSHREGIQEVREQRREGDGDDEPAEQEPHPDDGAEDREPPERRDPATGGGLGPCRSRRHHRRDRDGRC